MTTCNANNQSGAHPILLCALGNVHHVGSCLHGSFSQLGRRGALEPALCNMQCTGQPLSVEVTLSGTRFIANQMECDLLAQRLPAAYNDVWILQAHREILIWEGRRVADAIEQLT